MRPRRAPASEPTAPAPPDGYRTLSVAEVLADLPSLDSEQLWMVKSLEEAGDRRPVILDRIEDLLVVQEAARHVQASSMASPTEAPAPASPEFHPLPNKALSSELLDQMSGLLAKDAARRSPTLHPAPPAGYGAAGAGYGSATQGPPGSAGYGPTTLGPGAAGPFPAPAASAVIVPGNGRRARRGRRARTVLLALLVAAAVAAGGLAWQQTHHTTGKAATPAAPTFIDPVAARLVKTVPPGFLQQPDSVGDTGPSDLAKAARHDGAPGAQTALTQAGFLHGYQRMWRTTDQKQTIVVTVYHFRTAAGASAYAARIAAADAAGTPPAPAPASFAVAGIPGAVGYADGGDTSVTLTRGVYSVNVQAEAPDGASSQSLALQVAAAQYALLPAG